MLQSFMKGKLVVAGTRVLFVTYENANLVVEEYSNGGTLSAVPEVTTITCIHGDNFSGGEYFIINSPIKNYYVWYLKDHVGEDPQVQYATGLPVNLYSGDDATVVATKTAAVLTAVGAFTAVAAAEVITVTNTLGGPVPNPNKCNSGFLFEVTTEGEKVFLFNASLGIDVIDVLDAIVGTDGSAKLMLLVAQERKVARTRKEWELQKENTVLYKELAAGTLFV